MKRIIGIILLVVGLFFVYQGLEQKETFGAKAEREVSEFIDINEETNESANIKLIGGGIAAVAGLVLIIIGVEKKKII